MSADNLLLWMSARREGTWQQFRAAVEELHMESGENGVAENDAESPDSGFPIYHELRLNLQRLAHAEFFATDAQFGWRIAPPSLSIHTAPTGVIGVICGARSLKLFDGVMAAAGGLKPALSSSSAFPTCIIFEATDTSALRNVAAEFGMRTQNEGPRAILRALPSISDQSCWPSAELPVGDGWTIERFSTSKRSWATATREQAETARNGLFRFRHSFRRHFFFKNKYSVFAASAQQGKFAALRQKRRNATEFDASNNTMRFPVSCRPPVLIERALVLCSGRLPALTMRQSESFLEYANVPEDVARVAASILDQKIQ